MSCNLYTDDSFPNLVEALHGEELFYPQYLNISWKRPKELSENPSLIGKNEPSLPVQGLLGNCWLFTSFFFLSKNVHHLQQLFLNKNDFEKEYNGRFNFQLWNSSTGSWTSVTIDDRLPTVSNQLIAGSCANKNQFWVPLLEKACAKFYGSYQALSSGLASEGYMLLTGGYCWKKEISLQKKNELDHFKLQIKKALKNPHSMIVFISVNHNVDFLVAHHYYAMVEMNESQQTESNLIKLWNPWNGEEKQNVSLSLLFQGLPSFTFATLSLNSIEDQPNKWQDNAVIGRWEAGQNCGGFHHTETFYKNMQYLVSMQSCECILFVCLIQKNKREFKKRKSLQQAIGLSIWSLPEEPKAKLDQLYLTTNQPTFSYQPRYQGDISMFCSPAARHKHVLIIPSTFAPDVNCSFLLRICTSQPSRTRQF